MSDTPYYLRQNEDVPAPVMGTVEIFNYSNLDSIKYEAPKTGIIESVSESVNKAGDWVWDSAKGSWDVVTSKVEALSDKALDTVAGAYSFLKWEVIFWVGAAMVVVYFLVRTGALTQVAALMKPI